MNTFIHTKCFLGIVFVLAAVLAGCQQELPKDEVRELFPDQDPVEVARRYLAIHQQDYFEGMDFGYEDPAKPGVDTGNQTNRRDVAEGAGQAVDSTDLADETDGENDTASNGSRPDQLEYDKDEFLGRNTWMMWTGGNQAFWDHLARDSTGLVDLLRLVDNQHLARKDRFRVLGLVPEPGFRAPSTSDSSRFFSDDDIDAIERFYKKDFSHLRQFEHGLLIDVPTQDKNYQSQYRDGYLTPHERLIYGYPSGVIGLRLFVNPDFSKSAQRRWDPERFRSDESYYKDENLVRPFRVGMSCAVCHVSYNPLKPPADHAHPKWENLAGNVGNQYWRTGQIFGYDMRPDSLIWQMLNSGQPGTIDTSLVATDGNNNPNTMNSVYGVLPRVIAAYMSAREVSSDKTVNGIGTLDGLRLDPKILSRLDQETVDKLVNLGHVKDGALVFPDNPRHTPKVLAVGEDSVGTLAALCRVYVNIGEFHQQWLTNQTVMLGVFNQNPFSLENARNNSVYWNSSLERAPYLAKYFLKATTPKKLEHAKDSSGKDVGAEWLKRKWDYTRGSFGASDDRFEDAEHKAMIATGKEVFANNCFVCHSSKQPDYFWAEPANYDKWMGSESYLEFARKEVAKDNFDQNNYFSTDVRYPVTLIGTNAGRSLADNALEGRVWEQFSSDEYKKLDPVKSIEVDHPYKDSTWRWTIPRLNENEIASGRQRLYGPGYYRPHTLLSIWSTAPFLHNNSVGKYPDDQSQLKGNVPGLEPEDRLEVFYDSAEKLLWPDKRAGRDSIALTTTESGFHLPFQILRNGLKRVTGYETIILFHRSPWVFPFFAFVFGIALLARGRQRPHLALKIFGGAMLVLATILWYDLIWQDETQRLWSHPTAAHWLVAIVITWLGIQLWLSSRRMDIAMKAIALALVLAGVLFWFTDVSWTIPVGLVFTGLALLLGLFDIRYALWLFGFGIVVFSVVVLYRSHHFMFVLWFPLLGLVLLAIGLGLLWAANNPDLAFRLTGRLVVFLAIASFFVGLHLRDRGLTIGRIPKGTPVNLIVNLNSPGTLEDKEKLGTLLEVAVDLIKVERRRLPTLYHRDVPNLVPNLLKINKCPDMVVDRGHTFGEDLTDKQKYALIEYLKTL